MSNFAIIGKGFIYPRHKQAIESLGHKVLLTCDINKKTKPNFTDWVEMFNHPKFTKIDYVSICTPNYLHSIITREALLKGKKVLCEKPLSVNGTQGMEGVNTVLQLRYNPAVMHLKERPPYHLDVEAKMFRDEKYWKGWKGDDIKSGGILYNLGIHYIDLLAHVLGGDGFELADIKKTKKCVSGLIYFTDSAKPLDGRVGKFHIEIVDSKEKQGRKMFAYNSHAEIPTEVILSNQENLSYEDLHKEVYKEMLEGRGIGLGEAQKALDLVKAILEYDM